MLTGEEISGEMAVSFGFADYLVDSSRIPQLLQELSLLSDVGAIKSLIKQKYAVQTVDNFTAERLMFRKIFSNLTSFTAVRENLEELKKNTYLSPREREILNIFYAKTYDYPPLAMVGNFMLY